MSMLRFDGDVVIVTGAGGGMGRCHALELARRGARVVVNDLGGHPFGGGEDAGLADAVVQEIRSQGGEAIANTASVADVDGAASMTEQAMDTWGRLDAIVANAAIVRDRPFDEMTVADFDDVIDVNLRGTMRVVQPAYKAMRAGGGGRIVTVTSSSGMLGAHFQANYAASKSAMIGFTRAIALEGAAHGIKANAVAPGALGTRMHLAMVEAGGLNAESGADLVQNEAAAELMKPERVSPLITLLTHPSCPVTGEILCSWGGYYGRFGITTNRGWTSVETLPSPSSSSTTWTRSWTRPPRGSLLSTASPAERRMPRRALQRRRDQLIATAASGGRAGDLSRESQPALPRRFRVDQHEFTGDPRRRAGHRRHGHGDRPGTFFEDVFSLVDPDEVRWIFLTHDDDDHSGNLMEALDRCKNASVVMSWAARGRTCAAFGIPHRSRPHRRPRTGAGCRRPHTAGVASARLRQRLHRADCSIRRLGSTSPPMPSVRRCHPSPSTGRTKCRSKCGRRVSLSSTTTPCARGSRWSTRPSSRPKLPSWRRSAPR